jgi:hypothetical protein
MTCHGHVASCARVQDFAVIFAPGVPNSIIRLSLMLRRPTIVSDFESGYLVTLLFVTAKDPHGR